MRRAPELSPLSREHHAALKVAMRLRRASPADAAQSRDAFVRFFDEEARPHFRAEEEILLPAFARHAPADDPDVVRVLVEHVELRAAAAELASRDSPPDPSRLRALGELLDAHVRHEERTLFPRIEAAFGERELATLGEALAAAEGGQRRPPP